MKAIICGTLMALAVNTAAAEDDDTANFMLPYCKLALNTKEAFANPNNAFFSGICNGTVDAVALMLHFKNADYPACIPDGLSRGQITKAVVRYSELHPEQTHMPFIAFAIRAIHKTWPCKN